MEAKETAHLVDTHAHLASSRFCGDLPGILDRAARAGVLRVVSVACDIEDSERNLELAGGHAGVAPTVGVHPLYVHEAPAGWEGLLDRLSADPKVCAVGETGLDYYHPPGDGGDEASWRSLQRAFFERQLQLAVDTGLPAVIHQRESAADVTAVLRQFPGVRAVLHCFSGSPAEAEAALEMGLHLSFTGNLTYPKNEALREAARLAPLGRVMLETDCPYLAPVPHRGKRCEPAMTALTALRLAELHGIAPEEVAEATTRTAEAFFRNLPPPAPAPGPGGEGAGGG